MASTAQYRRKGDSAAACWETNSTASYMTSRPQGAETTMLNTDVINQIHKVVKCIYMYVSTTHASGAAEVMSLVTASCSPNTLMPYKH